MSLRVNLHTTRFLSVRTEQRKFIWAAPWELRNHGGESWSENGLWSSWFIGCCGQCARIPHKHAHPSRAQAAGSKNIMDGQCSPRLWASLRKTYSPELWLLASQTSGYDNSNSTLATVQVWDLCPPSPNPTHWESRLSMALQEGDSWGAFSRQEPGRS